MMWGRYRRLLNALAGLAIVPVMPIVPVVAQASVQECVALDDDMARLACYDGLFRDAGAAVGAAITISSERPIPARPRGREPATLSFSCIDGDVSVSFRFAGQLVSNTGDISPLTYQIDAGGTTVRTLRANADNTELSFASTADTQTFLDSLVGGSSVRVRVTPVRQRSVNVDFRLAPVADEIASLRASCG